MCVRSVPGAGIRYCGIVVVHLDHLLAYHPIEEENEENEENE